MPSAPFRIEQQLLALSLVAYRHCLRFAASGEPDREMATSIERALTTCEPTHEWDLCWGPATYRSTFSLLDEAMMFVVRNRQTPSRHAVVVRGTNPLSITDWLFGDLWADQMVRWPHGNAPRDARISLSASLGLSILQHIHGDVRGPVDFGFASAVLGVGLRASQRAFDAAIGGKLRPIHAQWHKLAAQVIPATPTNPMLAAERALERRSAASWKQLKSIVAESIDAVDADVHFDLYRFMHADVEQKAKKHGGVDLLGFLSNLVSTEPAEIWVTGHSKGAMLAMTLALWLADTQGKNVPEEQQWDPERNGQVHCLTFAGPTAGNDAFAGHCRSVLGQRLHRIANELDVVPKAWNAHEMATIPDLYGAQSPTPEVIRDLSMALAAEVRPLKYCHAEAATTLFRGPNVFDASYAEQLVAQHLDAYLFWADLSEHLRRDQIFGIGNSSFLASTR